MVWCVVVCGRTQPTVKLLLTSGDFSAALDLIHSTRRVLHTELKGVKCVHNIDVKLGEMLVLIERMMSTDFIRIAIHGSGDQLDSSIRESHFPRAITDEDMVCRMSWCCTAHADAVN